MYQRDGAARHSQEEHMELVRHLQHATKSVP